MGSLPKPRNGFQIPLYPLRVEFARSNLLNHGFTCSQGVTAAASREPKVLVISQGHELSMSSTGRLSFEVVVEELNEQFVITVPQIDCCIMAEVQL